jgi:hypothetical protein
MTLKVVGAGIGRTGTHSLKLALEQLLGGKCHHMLEVFEHSEQVPTWAAAARGEAVDWDALFADYVATVDWPGGAFWPELTKQYPDALVLLSVRSSADAWFKSASETIFLTMERVPPADDPMHEWYEMVTGIIKDRFTADYMNPDAAKAAYEKHNAAVRAAIPADRLLEWQPGDGWEPICERLGIAVPAEPFPHVNSTDEFRAMLGLPALN